MIDWTQLIALIVFATSGLVALLWSLNRKDTGDERGQSRPNRPHSDPTPDLPADVEPDPIPDVEPTDHEDDTPVDNPFWKLLRKRNRDRSDD